MKPKDTCGLWCLISLYSYRHIDTVLLLGNPPKLPKIPYLRHTLRGVDGVGVGLLCVLVARRPGPLLCLLTERVESCIQVVGMVEIGNIFLVFDHHGAVGDEVICLRLVLK